ncbi:MAG TPA: helix-turn-helix transcriptional regulator [Pseudonocardiaceae bacterium]|jgi:transcriptional regulator with XRE-family HTH domain|nr:helix-turn-helix transcriptional regulator [Pseudonocardiaceae bacterium]
MDSNQRCNASNNRSPRALALGTALKAARLDGEFGLREFAKEIGRDPSVLSRWESGERAPLPTEAAQILGKLGVTGKLYDQIIKLAYGLDDPMWLATSLPEQRAQLNALLDFERMTSQITEVSPLLVPGLLQTSDYARAIMVRADVPADEISTRVATRMGRREVLKKSGPFRFTALIGEAALRQQIGNARITAEQMGFLLEMAQHPNVDIRVLPFDSDWHPGLEGPVLLIGAENETSVVHLEVRGSGLFLHAPHDVSAYRAAVAKVTKQAISAEDSEVVIALAKTAWEHEA